MEKHDLYFVRSYPSNYVMYNVYEIHKKEMPKTINVIHLNLQPTAVEIRFVFDFV